MSALSIEVLLGFLAETATARDLGVGLIWDSRRDRWVAGLRPMVARLGEPGAFGDAWALGAGETAHEALAACWAHTMRRARAGPGDAEAGVSADVLAEELRRIREALERLAAAAEARAEREEPITFPNAPVLPKDRPRASGRGR